MVTTMGMVWIFLIVTNGHMMEIGKFQSEEVCEQTRKEVIIQRTEIGYPKEMTKDGYILTKYFETTKCFKVWK
jgi:hypothetical protein